MNRKKIGILAFGEKHGGGVYQYTQSIIDALKSDKTNEYIIFVNSYDSLFEKSYDLEVRKIDKPESIIIEKLIRFIQFLLLIRKPYFFSEKEFEIFNDIDIFISPGISAYPHFYLNKPFVFTLHDFQEKYYPEFFTKKERFLRWINNRTLTKSATKILCESIFVQNDLVKFNKVNKNRICVIQSPPPEEFLNFRFKNTQCEEIRLKYNLPEKYIFYPAQCWIHKNHINLVEAFEIVIQDINDIYLVLTGSQQNNYLNLIKRIDELGLSNKVKHIGFVDYEDLPYLYKMSKMLIMPTLFESVSIPIYEAFSLEVPVCCSDVVALPDQVGDAGLIFNPKDINDMANKILLYLNNEDLRKEKGKKGRERIVKFNHEEYKKKLQKILALIF